MITIKEAITKAELTAYIKFPFSLYKNDPNWIPPLISDELTGFDKTKNPAFLSAEAYFYMAFKDDKVVGRITAIINWDEVKNQQKSKVRFGWWDVIDDIEVTKALLEKVYELGRKHNLQTVEGPIGFSNLDKVGVLTEGYQYKGSMITWYNFPYYKNHLEQLGFIREKEFIESMFHLPSINPDFFIKAQEFIKKRYQLTPLNFTRTKDVMPYVDEMFDLFNRAYAHLSSFVAVSDVQKEYFKKKYIGLINPEYVKFVMDKNNKMIAFCIVMPDFSDAIKKANGKLFPFGFYHLLKARKSSKDVLFYLIGIEKEYQNKGVTAIIFDEFYKVFMKNGVQNCIRTPELEENNAIHNIWKHFDAPIHKRRRTYSRDIPY